MVNYYEVLGVAQSASLKDINGAYKKLALKYHPDKASGGASAVIQFRQIQEAIEVLRDPVQRENHDNELGSWKGTYFSPEYTTYENVPDGWPLWDAWYAEDEKYRREVEEREREEERRKMEEEKRRELEREARLQKEREARAKRMEAMRARVLRDEEELRQEERQQNGIHVENPMLPNGGTLGTDRLAEDNGIDGIDGLEIRHELYKESRAESHPDIEDSVQDGEGHEDTGEKEEKLVACSDFASSEVEAGNSMQGNKEREPKVDPHPLEHLIPFFQYKLTNSNGRYGVEDFHVEITGFILESLQGWFEEQRQSIPGALPSHLANFAGGNEPRTCRHLGHWTKTFHVEDCDVCHRWLPLYLLTCQACGARACVSCKYRRTE